MKNSFNHITYEEKLLIQELVNKGTKIKDIAIRLNKHQSTIYREIKKGKTNLGYSPSTSHIKYMESLKQKGKECILSQNKNLADLISKFILQDNLTIIEIIDKLNSEYNIFITANTIYSSIEKGLINNVTKETLRSKYTKVFNNGLIQIPIHVRNKLNINDGDLLSIITKNNKIIISTN